MSHQRLLPAGNARDIFWQTIRQNVKMSAEARAAREKAKDQRAEEREAKRLKKETDAGGIAYRVFWPTVSPFYSLGLNPQPPKLDTARIEQLSKAEARKVVKPAERVPDMVECIVGWRGWSIKKVNGQYRLDGLGMSSIWTPGKPVEAECRARYTVFDPAGALADNHESPDKNCSCGIWAFRSLEEFQKMAANYKTAVVGQVYLWGRVLECENGFRAQFAYPKELWLMDARHEELGWIYNTPVRTL